MAHQTLSLRSFGPRRVRKMARDGLFACLRRISATDDGRAIAADTLRGALVAGPPFAVPLDTLSAQVYPELGAARPDSPTSGRHETPIFITGRFRSGSTLLWNVFRQIDGCTAYYEPLNERRWFDPSARGERTDPTHIGVSDYWREYQGLEALGAVYREEWIDRHLYMDASFWDPGLTAYVQGLIDAARGRAVLQFNRVDFRLAWLRAHFPHASLVHLYRHPRDQWCSSLVDPRSYGKDARMDGFEPHDHFYLLRWARDLRHRFPFVEPSSVSHPYALFYYLWKLSYIFGTEYADVSVCFEDLMERPRQELARLMQALAVRDYDMARLAACIVPQKRGKWREYAEDDWFRRHESACETVLREFFMTGTQPSRLKPAPPISPAGAGFSVGGGRL